MEKMRVPRGKRVFDVAVSMVMLVVFLPVVLLIFLAMAVESMFVPSSRGRFLYSEERISQGEPFTLYKIRILTTEALEKAEGGYIAAKKLERRETNLTYVGRFLKKIYFDELGQLINVLRGDMTLVGPRPKSVADYERLYRRGYRVRYVLKAGLTGYFQSNEGREPSLDQEQVDMEYARFCRYSSTWRIVFYDLKIVFITIRAVLRREGI